MLKRLIGFVLLGATMSTSMLININSTIPHIARDTKGISSTYIREERVKQFEELTQKYIEEQEKLRLEEERRIEEERIRLEQESKKVPMIFELSAYCSCNVCSDSWGTQTASGLTVQEGFVALPDDIPFGTKVIIPSLGSEYICADRGGFIDYTNEGYMRVDVYMRSHEACLEFGRFTVEGYLLYE